jgi:Domain of unknown function (DUF1816)
MTMKLTEIWTNTLDLLGQAWWVEVSTVQPKCTYYFGPFAVAQEAQEAASGYIEDLQNEGAQGIEACVKRCKPTVLTIDAESPEMVEHSLGELTDRKRGKALSGQISVS